MTKYETPISRMGPHGRFRVIPKDLDEWWAYPYKKLLSKPPRKRP
jgi:hypothetical protein